MIAKPTPPRRPRWRSLALLALSLAPLLWPLHHLAERYYQDELASQNRQTLDLYVANLLGTLHRYETLPQILGDLPALRGVLADPFRLEAVTNANRLLKDIVQQTGAEVMYLMDVSGNTLAASNWDKHDTFGVSPGKQTSWVGRPDPDASMVFQPLRHKPERLAINCRWAQSRLTCCVHVYTYSLAREWLIYVVIVTDPRRGLAVQSLYLFEKQYKTYASSAPGRRPRKKEARHTTGLFIHHAFSA